jgi:hypothetical protein
MKKLSLLAAALLATAATSAFAEKCVDQSNPGNTCNIELNNEGNLSLVLPNGDNQEWRVKHQSADGNVITLKNDAYEEIGNCMGPNIKITYAKNKMTIDTASRGNEGGMESYTLVCK